MTKIPNAKAFGILLITSSLFTQFPTLPCGTSLPARMWTKYTASISRATQAAQSTADSGAGDAGSSVSTQISAPTRRSKAALSAGDAFLTFLPAAVTAVRFPIARAEAKPYSGRPKPSTASGTIPGKTAVYAHSARPQRRRSAIVSPRTAAAYLSTEPRHH